MKKYIFILFLFLFFIREGNTEKKESFCLILKHHSWNKLLSHIQLQAGMWDIVFKDVEIISVENPKENSQKPIKVVIKPMIAIRELGDQEWKNFPCANVPILITSSIKNGTKILYSQVPETFSLTRGRKWNTFDKTILNHIDSCIRKSRTCAIE